MAKRGNKLTLTKLAELRATRRRWKAGEIVYEVWPREWLPFSDHALDLCEFALRGKTTPHPGPLLERRGEGGEQLRCGLVEDK